MAPALVGEDSPPAVAQELETLMRERSDETAVSVARAFLLEDYREDLGRVSVPTLVMQGSKDPFVPLEVGRFMERQLPEGHFVQLAATGHFPSLSAPSEVIAAIRAFL
jgi:sigma-B regulation protein RsbQ